MVSELANYLNNPPRYAGVTVSIAVLGVLIAIGFLCLGIKNKDEEVSAWEFIFGLLGIVVGGMMVFFSSNISYRLEKTNLQTELSSKMEVVDNEYPYQISITDNNDNVYFVFCKTKNDQNKVIKTMNTGNNPAIKFSGHVATYTNLPQKINNGVQAEKKIEEKDLIPIVKNNFEEF